MLHLVHCLLYTSKLDPETYYMATVPVSFNIWLFLLLNAGRTGLTEAQAKEAGYDVVTALVPTDDKAHYRCV